MKEPVIYFFFILFLFIYLFIYLFICLCFVCVCVFCCCCFLLFFVGGCFCFCFVLFVCLFVCLFVFFFFWGGGNRVEFYRPMRCLALWSGLLRPSIDLHLSSLSAHLSPFLHPLILLVHAKIRSPKGKSRECPFLHT